MCLCQKFQEASLSETVVESVHIQLALIIFYSDIDNSLQHFMLASNFSSFHGIFLFYCILLPLSPRKVRWPQCHVTF